VLGLLDRVIDSVLDPFDRLIEIGLCREIRGRDGSEPRRALRPLAD
jgi:hypothetical protein